MTTSLSNHIRRFTAKNPCPICQGYDQMNRGSQKRCYGFLSSDGLYAHCTREEHAGGLPGESGDTYAHKLNGKCNCGIQHGPELFDNNNNSKPLIFDMSEIRSKKDKITTTTQKDIQETNKTAKKSNNNFNYDNPDYIWDYTDELGQLLYQVIRCDYEDGEKKIKQRRMLDNGKWEYKLDGARRVVHDLPGLLALPKNQPVIITEGEKAMDACLKNGLPATTATGGAGKWDSSFNEWFRGRKVIILGDNDEAGRKHAQVVYENLKQVAMVKVVELPGLPEKGDCYEWFHDLGKSAKELAEACHAVEYTYPPKFLYTIDELDLLPPVEWLLDDIFQTNSLSMSVGESGIGKTFMIINYALRIAAEKEKLVVYVASEAVSQYKSRIDTWITYYQMNPGRNFMLSTFPLRLMDPQSVVEFIKLLQAEELNPAMIVIDTLHAAAEGSEENSAKDAGAILANLRLMRDTFKANVHVVHHMGKTNQTERGSSAFRGGMETVFEIKANTNGAEGIKLTCTKQRSAVHFQEHTYTWAYPEGTASRVPVLGNYLQSAAKPYQRKLNQGCYDILATLNMSVFEDGIPPSRLADHLGLEKNGPQKTTFYQNLDTLLDRGMIMKQEQGRNKLYTITRAGKDIIEQGEI